jgi:drug/metabolite transporter (DMT)-like permease
VTIRSTSRISGTASLVIAPTIVGGSVAVAAVLADFPLYGGQATRYAIAAVILLVVMRVRRISWRPMGGRDLLTTAVLAGFGLVAFNICVISATRYLSPSAVGAVIGASPVIFALVGPLQRRVRPQPLLVTAGVAVTAGVVLTQGPLGAISLIGLLLAVGALAGELGFSLFAVGLLTRFGPLQVSAMTCLFAVPELLLVGVLLPGPLLEVPTAAEGAALLYMAVLATAIAFVLFYKGLAELGAAVAGLFSGLIPVAALVASVLLGREQPHWYSAGGVTLVAAGIVVGNLANRRRAGKASTGSVPAAGQTFTRAEPAVDSGTGGAR